MSKQNEIYSEEVEKNIIGCLLVFKEDLRYVKTLESEEFYMPIHQKIFTIIQSLIEKEKPVDIISVKEEAATQNLDTKKLFNYLISVTDSVITSANLEFYITKLKNYSMRRKIIEKAKKIINDMNTINSDIEAEEIKKEAMQDIADIKIQNVINKEYDINNLIADTLQDIEDKYKKRDDYKYHTGFFELDKVTDGLHEQELTLIAARPGCGKTALALNIAENISRKGIYTYFVSLEMSEKQIGNRLFSSKTAIDSHRIRTGWLEEQDFEKIGQASTELADLKMIIDAKSTTIQEIELKAIELKERKNIGLIIIDYLQLLKSKTKFNIREQEVAEISRKLKLLSKELNIPIIALCQLNRESLKRTRPTNADLRESGSLEQDADNIIFIYADDQELQNKVVETELIISKQRNGPTGTVKVRFDKKTMTYQNIVR